MIFISKNEKGIPAWQLVIDGKKTVTRRLKYLAPGKVFAVQPGRCKKGIAKAQVISCIPHEQFMANIAKYPAYDRMAWLISEAHREGFESWAGLLAWFDVHKVDINETYRTEFLLVKS